MSKNVAWHRPVKPHFYTGISIERNGATMQERIEAILDQAVRPKLASHGGNVKFLSVVDGVVYIQLLGQCSACPASYLTVEQLIAQELKGAIPEIQAVAAQQSVSEELLTQARGLMGRHHG